MHDQLQQAIYAIDDLMGDGYARKNPDLIGRMLQADSIRLLGEILFELVAEDAQDTMQ